MRTGLVTAVRFDLEWTLSLVRTLYLAVSLGLEQGAERVWLREQLAEQTSSFSLRPALGLCQQDVQGFSAPLHQPGNLPSSPWGSPWGT